ncbi:MAG: hypothetical protein EOP05_10595 [Proteobacteria bacterium]|nr:MAG: hypothetical protein EOP05_10595 [Pseudomonadota bacterium]
MFARSLTRSALALGFATLTSLLASLLAAQAHAEQSTQTSSSEPRYCTVEAFKKLERGNNIPYLDRAHVFQVGQLTLAGLGVGNSDHRYVQSLADQYGDYQAYEKSCVFYFNKGNDDAIAAFNQQYVTSPILKSKKVASKYDEVISPLIDQTAVNMLSCAEDHKFIAMGCDGMRHRGPSVFAMLLAYSGCTAENATKIANAVWGTNHVPTGTRTAIAQKGWEAGNRNPAGRARLQKLMTTRQ